MTATAERTARPLTATGAILLVSCYELGHQPLNLASPLAVLREAGFAPIAVDTSLDPLDDETIRQAQFVAISVPMHTALRLGARVAAYVRSVNPAAHICFYGLYATLNASYLLEQHGDSVISGEYESALVDLARAIAAGKPAETVAQVGTRTRPAEPVLERIPLMAPVRAELPELRRYAGLERDRLIVRAGYVETTRGCHHTCSHCPITPIYGGRFFALPRELVIADAKAQIDAGARHITFGDPDFFNGPRHGLRIMAALREYAPSVTFDATIKIEHLLQHRGLLPELAEHGCMFVVSAVESLSPRVLAKLKKGHTRAEVDEAIDLLDAVSIPMRPSLLPFTPWSSLDDYLELLSWVAERDLINHIDPVHFSIRLLVPPGSALLADPDAAEWLGDLDAAAFTYRWTHPDPRVDALQANVARIVEDAAAGEQEARSTFAAIWKAATEAAETPDRAMPAPRERRGMPPRLTESWFC